jgi:muconolactone delta-isomerase
MSVVTVTVPKEVYAPVSVSPEAVRALRAKLKAAIEQAWLSPEGQTLKQALSNAAQEYGARLQALYEQTGFNKQIQAIAAELDIGGKYKRLWGKV